MTATEPTTATRTQTRRHGAHRPVASVPAAPTITPRATAPVVPAPSTTDAPAPLTRRQARLRTASAAGTTAPAAVGLTAIRVDAGTTAPAAPATETADLRSLFAGAPASDAPTASQKPTADQDPFATAAKLFSFTGPTAVQPEPASAEAAADEDEAAGEQPSDASGHRARRRHGARPSLKRVTAASLSLSAIVAVGLLTVGATMPAEALASTGGRVAGAAPTQAPNVPVTQLAGDVDVSGSGTHGIQAYVAPASAPAPTPGLDRSASFSTASLVELAGTVGITNFSNAFFTNNPNCAVQWPFAVGVPISYGFGPRPGEFHTGVDFTPGDGAHIQAIADGVVRVAQEGYQGYGVAIIIDHVIDGQHWATLYGHMQYGSLQVKPGDHVRVGEYIGRTGDTGFSFGAHTHVELLQNGDTPVDPMPWLKAHNQC